MVGNCQLSSLHESLRSSGGRRPYLCLEILGSNPGSWSFSHVFSLFFLAPIFYIKRIPDAEIRIIGTVASLRQERSPESTNAPPVSDFVISSETAIKSERTDLERNVEESKRDVSLEELLSDGSKEGNKNKKSIEGENHLKTRIKSQKKSFSSTATGK